MTDTDKQKNENYEASFSVLVTSLASSTIMALGLAPNPRNDEKQKDRAMARFNIDLLAVLQEKTRGNLTSDEARFLEALLADLQLKFVQMRD